MKIMIHKLFGIIHLCESYTRFCRFIDIHPCFGSISNVFHNKIYRHYILNATTSVINTLKFIHGVRKTTPICFEVMIFY
jgi:hypothetical protein